MKSRIGYLYLLPALLLFGLFTLYPIGRSVQMSFQDFEFVDPDNAPYAGLKNYEEAVADPIARTAMWNTLRFVFMFLPVHILLPIPIAFLIDRLRRQVVMRVATFLPVVVSLAVTSVLWTTLYHPNFGPLTAVARWLGFQDVKFLGDQTTAMPSLVAMTIWHGLGFSVLLYLVRLANIPNDLYEAAAVDGAKRSQILWYVTLPLLRPAMYLVTVLGLIASLKVFGPMFIMTEGGPANTTLSMVLYVYRQAFTTRDLRFGYAAAMAVLLALVIMAFAIGARRLNRPVE